MIPQWEQELDISTSQSSKLIVQIINRTVYGILVPS